MQRYTLADGTTVIEPGTGTEAEKSSVRIIEAGTITAVDTVVNFDNGGCFVATLAGELELDVSGLNVGQRALIFLGSGATPATLTWAGVDRWSGTFEPELKASAFIAVELFNNGTEIVGSSLSAIEAAIADLTGRVETLEAP